MHEEFATQKKRLAPERIAMLQVEQSKNAHRNYESKNFFKM